MPRDVHRNGTIVLSISLMLLGIAIVVRTLEAGGGALSVGILVGGLFVIVGAGRLWTAWRKV